MSDILKKIRVGDIVRMEVASRSHEKTPYYVLIDKINENEIVTKIPGRHSLSISKRNGNWDYQLNRMTYVGNAKKFGSFLKGQKLICIEPSILKHIIWWLRWVWGEIMGKFRCWYYTKYE